MRGHERPFVRLDTRKKSFELTFFEKPRAFHSVMWRLYLFVLYAVRATYLKGVKLYFV